jgi:hypothetical protein
MVLSRQWERIQEKELRENEDAETVEGNWGGGGAVIFKTPIIFKLEHFTILCKQWRRMILVSHGWWRVVLLLVFIIEL